MCDTQRVNVVTLAGKPYDPGARSCAICGAEFAAVRSTARYCSDKCRLTAARQRRRKGLRVLPLELPDTAGVLINAGIGPNVRSWGEPDTPG